MQTISTEDYIKAIYKLEQKGERATTSAIAAHLQLSDASVTDMVKKLSDKGFVEYKRYQGVELTEGGRRFALKTLRRHRLWEMFLVEFLGYSWDQIHDEAERLEHVTSDELERRLDKALGYPALDPHGDPIPDADGSIKGISDRPLTDYSRGDVVKVSRVSDDDPEILAHATTLGLALNSRITVKEKRGFDGSMVLKVGTREQFVSKRVAQAIFVQPV